MADDGELLLNLTDELPASHYFKRLSMIGVSFGDSSGHLRRHAQS